MSTPENPQPKHIWFAEAYSSPTSPAQPLEGHETAVTAEAPAPTDRVAEHIDEIKQQFNLHNNTLKQKIVDGEEYEGFSWRTRNSQVTGASAQIDLFRKVDETGQPSDIIEGSIKSKSKAGEREIRLFTLNTSEGTITGPNGDDDTAHGIAIDLERHARCEYRREVMQDMAEEARPLAGFVAVGLVLVGTLMAIGYIREGLSDKGMTAAEYAQSFDQKDYLLDIPMQSYDSIYLPEITEQTFNSIPPYRQGDSLTSPRIYNFKLGGETCKTFTLPIYSDSTTSVRLAVRQREQYKNGSQFGVIYGEKTLSICRTNPEKQEKKDSSDTAHMGIAIQLPDPSTEIYGQPIN